MTKIGTRIYVWLFCDLVGKDNFGNKYYIDKKIDFEGKRKRMVVYNGVSDASKIPPLWHSWIHYNSSEVPSKKIVEYPWQQKYQSNLTGTRGAYFPFEKSKDMKFWKPTYREKIR